MRAYGGVRRFSAYAFVIAVTGCVALARTGDADASALTILYSFSDTRPFYGFDPQATLVMGPHGALYGSTEYGGTGCEASGSAPSGCGVLFQLAPNDQGLPNIYHQIHAFTGGDSDGAHPFTGMVIDDQGYLYGTTPDDGAFSCGPSGESCGVLFMDVPPASKGDGWTHEILHYFGGGTDDGAAPEAALTRDPNTGTIYGTTCAGGQYNNGTVFTLPANGFYSIIHSFVGGKSSDCPAAPLTIDPTTGDLLGTSYDGGSTGNGTVFRLHHGSKGWTFSLLHSFSVDDENPAMGVTPYLGDLFGTTFYGLPELGPQTGTGAVYRLHFNGSEWVETVLLSFDPRDNGANPTGERLWLDSSGNLFGTTSAGEGSSYNRGTVYELVNKSGSYSCAVLHTFGLPASTFGRSGLNAQGGVIRDSAGNFYGVTESGGAYYASSNANFAGTVYMLKASAPPSRCGG
jgi:uncharacterized repeat protein (TIGR03803 family)